MTKKEYAQHTIYKRNILLGLAVFGLLLAYVGLVNGEVGMNYALAQKQQNLQNIHNDITTLSLNIQYYTSPSYVYQQSSKLDLVSIQNPQYLGSEQSLSFLSQ
ncbi:hypothetical protein M1534_02380 [Patescibacteria group bacterium]|jgi:hypothetical protein|nr:hypothetical protein [Patescibacteria group bacterium]